MEPRVREHGERPPGVERQGRVGRRLFSRRGADVHRGHEVGREEDFLAEGVHGGFEVEVDD